MQLGGPLDAQSVKAGWGGAHLPERQPGPGHEGLQGLTEEAELDSEGCGDCALGQVAQPWDQDGPLGLDSPLMGGHSVFGSIPGFYPWDARSSSPCPLVMSLDIATQP